MKLWPFRQREERAAPDVAVPQSDPNFLRILGLDAGAMSVSDIAVTTDSALGVPALWAAVNFLAGTIAGLPLPVYDRADDGGRKKVVGGIAALLSGAVNPATTSFAWRKLSMEHLLTGGRWLSFIERAPSGEVINIWPLDPSHVTIRRRDWTQSYEYRPPNQRPVVYGAEDIIDLPFMLRSDGLSHRGPIAANKDVIGLAIAATRYASRYLQKGGVPPFAITGNFQSTAALQRAGDDLEAAVKKAAAEGRQALTLPLGLEVKPIGVDPEKNQLVELQRWSVEQVARIYSLPPTFLQDLTHGTFSNSEQQDLHFVKHTLSRWVRQIEQELNLKLFGRGRTDRYVEINVDGLLRGDFKTRMEGYALGIQNAILTPEEIRVMENREKKAGGDQLMIQGATVPLGSQPGAPQGGKNG